MYLTLLLYDWDGMLEVTSWGRLSTVARAIIRPALLDAASAAIRSCDDSASPFIAFEPQKGIVGAEVGLTLDRLLRVVVPTGWFAPVVHGAKFVTLGGAAAKAATRRS